MLKSRLVLGVLFALAASFASANTVYYDPIFAPPGGGELQFTDEVHPAVLGSVLSGVNTSASGTVAATDTLLSAPGKLQRQATDVAAAPLVGTQLAAASLELSANCSSGWAEGGKVSRETGGVLSTRKEVATPGGFAPAGQGLRITKSGAGTVTYYKGYEVLH